MYLTIEQTAEYLQVDVAYVLQLLRDKQITGFVVEQEILINQHQFDFFLQQRKKLIEEYQRYLDEPIPEDIDVKDED